MNASGDTWARTNESDILECRLHGSRFRQGVETCLQCTAPPKRPPNVSVPDYWSAKPYYVACLPGVLAVSPGDLRCEYHGERFADDEMCRVCARQDGLSTP